MNIKYLNLLNNTFYNRSLIGGASSSSSTSTTNSSSKFILLSCPEFNETINTIITLDTNDKDLITRKENELKSNSIETINSGDYERFLEDIGQNLDDILEKENKEIEERNKQSASQQTLKTRLTSEKIIAL